MEFSKQHHDYSMHTITFYCCVNYADFDYCMLSFERALDANENEANMLF